ncbi:MAG: hypothetical protein J6V01_04310, partial [Clostridia bacterium]|nr:hypothetical protein [Clostridia bacterium]
MSISEDPANNGYYFDIVFCIDATRSMRGIIDNIKRNALSLYRTLVDQVESLGLSVKHLRQYRTIRRTNLAGSFRAC